MKTKQIIFLLLVFFKISAQVNNEKEIQLVLKKDIVGKEFIFDKSNKEEVYKLELTYFGAIKTNKRKTLKILISSTFRGLKYSPHQSCAIFIYDKNNSFQGYYSVGDYTDLPEKIKGKNLIFSYKENKDCDPKAITKINFQNGCPKEIFLICKNGFGNIYPFHTEKYLY